MATRTMKLLGTAYSTSGDVTLVVNFNNSEVFNNTVTTVSSAPPAKETSSSELATWTVDTSLTGAIPLTITATGGTFVFNNITGDYAGVELQEEADPENPGEVVRSIVDGAYVVITQPADFVGELNYNTSASDGKDNVTWTNYPAALGTPPARSLQDADDYGDWMYEIPDGATFACDFTIEPELTVTTVPTPPTP